MIFLEPDGGDARYERVGIGGEPGRADADGASLQESRESLTVRRAHRS